MAPDDFPANEALKRALSGPPGFEAERSWEALSGKLAPGAQPRNKQRSWWQIGISLAAVITIAIAGIKYTSTQSTPQSKTYTTHTGERIIVNLADGSEITLAPSTIMRVSGRNVELQGEAVFTVNQHAGEPFTVKSGNTITLVLGTTFGVRAYDDVRVAVRDGKVLVDQNVLSAGDVAMIKNNHAYVTHSADVTSMLSWTRGRLSFDNTTIQEMLTELNRWYSLDMRLADKSDKSQLVSASFETSEPASQIINSVARMLNVRAERNGSTVTFYSR